MTEAPSPRQLDVLRAVVRLQRDKGYPPTRREIGEAIGICSSAAITTHLDALVKKGLLRREAGIPRSITPTPAGERHCEGTTDA